MMINDVHRKGKLMVLLVFTVENVTWWVTFQHKLGKANISWVLRHIYLFSLVFVKPMPITSLVNCEDMENYELLLSEDGVCRHWSFKQFSNGLPIKVIHCRDSLDKNPTNYHKVVVFLWSLLLLKWLFANTGRFYLFLV